MSSSRSGQWMPCPLPINRQLAHSGCVACNSRGNQPSGADIVRPSLSSALNASSFTITRSIVGLKFSTPEVAMPCLDQFLLVVIDKLPNCPLCHSDRGHSTDARSVGLDLCSPEFLAADPFSGQRVVSAFGEPQYLAGDSIHNIELARPEARSPQNSA